MDNCNTYSCIDVFKDGRLLTVANLVDRVIMHTPGSRLEKKVKSLTQIQSSVKQMMLNDIKVCIPECVVVPTVALWASSTRLVTDNDLDGLEDINGWRKQYERAFNIKRERTIPSKQYVEKASGIEKIEEWLVITTIIVTQSNIMTCRVNVLAKFVDPVLQKSKLSDALYCSVLCINTCDNYQQELKGNAEGFPVQ